MLTIIRIDDDGIHLADLEAHAASGHVLLGSTSEYTDRDIWDWCDENLCAPEEGQSDYQGWPVFRPA